MNSALTTSTSYSSSASSGTLPVSSPALSGPKPDYTVSLFDALKFNGPAPELVNGRLAMIGMVAAAYQESQTGQSLPWMVEHVSLGVCLGLAVWVYASLAPICKGVKQEAFGPFSPRAELANGRAAMLGFAVLYYLENNAGAPFF